MERLELSLPSRQAPKNSNNPNGTPQPKPESDTSSLDAAWRTDDGVDKPQETIEAQALKKFAHIRSRDEACKIFEGNIVTYTDQTALVQNCKQRNIEDPELLNELIYSYNKTINEIPAKVFRMIPFGTPFQRADLTRKGKEASKTISKEECETYNGKYITVSGTTYYFVENCKKRPFDDFYDLQEHNQQKAPIVTLNPEQILRLPTGPGLKVKTKDEAGILMRMNGDVIWSKLGPGRGTDNAQADSPQSLDDIRTKSKIPVQKDAVCKEFEKKVVSFYSQIYFVDKCELRVITDFSMLIQQAIEERGGVIDLTREQLQVLRKGKDIVSSDVLKALR